MHRFVLPFVGLLVAYTCAAAAPLRDIKPTASRERHVRPAIPAKAKIGTPNIGLTVANARFANYGAYLQRMMETIQEERDRLFASSRPTPPAGTYVLVRFMLNPAGRVGRVRSENYSNEAGANLALAAVTSAAPFGQWTDDMTRVLGPEEELILTFYYN